MYGMQLFGRNRPQRVEPGNSGGCHDSPECEYSARWKARAIRRLRSVAVAHLPSLVDAASYIRPIASRHRGRLQTSRRPAPATTSIESLQ